MKRYLARRYCRGRWCLCLDVDELFDFPRSAQTSLRTFIEYLNNKGFNAVITQMLDMFSDRPISDAKIEMDTELRKQCPFYDLSNIAKSPYHFGRVPDPALMMHRGGIRKAISGTDNGLTKFRRFLEMERSSRL